MTEKKISYFQHEENKQINKYKWINKNKVYWNCINWEKSIYIIDK